MTATEPQPKAIEVEIIPSEVDRAIVKYAAQTGLEKQSTETLVEAFRPIFARAREAISDAAGVAESVKDATCVREIMRSRACRLALRKIRLESDETREKHKKHALLYGRAVDGFHNILMADLSPVETALKEAEEIAERAEAKRLAELKAAREAELAPLLEVPVILGNLADLSEAQWNKALADAKLLRQAKLDAAAKIETERKAREEAAFVAAAKAEAENARLKAEAVAREAAAKAEREAAEKKLAEERAEAARVAAEIKAKADAEAKAAAEQAARERAEIEAKAKAEADRLAEIARKEQREALAKAKAESDRLAAIAAQERNVIEAKAKADAEDAAKARAEKLAMEKEIRDRVTNEQAQAAAAAAAAKKAAAASDGVKLKRFADELRALPKPTLKNSKIQSALTEHVEDLAAWVESSVTSDL